MKTDDQIQEIAQDAILGLLQESVDSGIAVWLDNRYEYLDRETVNRVLVAIHDAVNDAKVSVSA